MTSSPGPTPTAARAIWSADVPLFVARQNRAPTAVANSASSAFISGAPTPDSTPRSRTRATAARSASVRIGQRRGVTVPVAVSCGRDARSPPPYFLDSAYVVVSAAISSIIVDQLIGANVDWARKRLESRLRSHFTSPSG